MVTMRLSQNKKLGQPLFFSLFRRKFTIVPNDTLKGITGNTQVGTK